MKGRAKRKEEKGYSSSKDNNSHDGGEKKGEFLDLIEEVITYISSAKIQDYTFKKIVKREEGYFEVMSYGWNENKVLIHSVVAHVEYYDGFIRIYADKTNLDIMDWLLDKGISKSQ